MNTLKHQLISRSVLIVVLFLSSFNLFAQFTYVGVNLGYSNTGYDRRGFESAENSTKSHQGRLQFRLLSRPLRNFAFGLDIGVPVVNVFRWSFDGSPTNFGVFYDDSNEFSSDPVYKPTTYEYDIKNGISTTLKARIIPAVDGTFYIDFRYSFLNVREEFTFTRSGPFANNIQHLKNHSAKGPGFAIGLQELIGEQFYFHYEFSIDFYKFDFDEDSFEYTIQYSSSELVTLSSRISEREINYQLNVGFGYLF